MHDLCIFLICFCSKIIFDKIFFLCWDKLDYPGSIAYLSFFVQKSFLNKNYFLNAEINLTPRGPLYTDFNLALHVVIFWRQLICFVLYVDANTFPQLYDLCLWNEKSRFMVCEKNGTICVSKRIIWLNDTKIACAHHFSYF